MATQTIIPERSGRVTAGAIADGTSAREVALYLDPDQLRRSEYKVYLHTISKRSFEQHHPIYRNVVIPACEAALAHRRGEHARVVDLLAPRHDQIRLLGGSNAQRDLFFQMLIDSAMKANRGDVVSAMIAHETATRAVPPTQRAGYAAAARWLHS